MREVQESDVRKLVREAVERAMGADSGRPVATPDPLAHGRPALPDLRRVAIGSDHGGFDLKQVLRRFLVDELGWEVQDYGTSSSAPVDYPDFAAAVAREVASGRCARGIVIDSAGIGSSMAANKVAGVRCALCHDDATVLNSREHNDAN